MVSPRGPTSSTRPLKVACYSAEATNPAQSAFQTTAVLNLLGDLTSDEKTIALPAGRRFVIEYVNVDVLLSGASWLIEGSFISNINGVGAIYYVPLAVIDNLAIASLPVKIYADGGITVRLNRAAGGQTLVRFVFSGYLVDL